MGLANLTVKMGCSHYKLTWEVERSGNRKVIASFPDHPLPLLAYGRQERKKETAKGELSLTVSFFPASYKLKVGLGTRLAKLKTK